MHRTGFEVADRWGWWYTNKSASDAPTKIFYGIMEKNNVDEITFNESE